MSNKIEIPREVQLLFDEADGKKDRAISFTATHVQLTLSDGITVIREIEWNQANEFARNLLANILEAQK
jgi:hypothetical protein